MIQGPTEHDLRRVADREGIRLSSDEVAVYLRSIEQTMNAYRTLADLPEPSLPGGDRGPVGHRPPTTENLLSAWAWVGSLKLSSTGPLGGKRVAIKDNVAVAGMPLSNGTALLDGFIPAGDATVVTRILAAGGEIVGKAVCENLCFSGGSHTSDSGPVLNPRAPGYMAGGSSSGSAALLASDACDLAIGGDQGGSIRIPASWCGVYGLKPTWGLVPYTGAFPIEPSLDHLGPMANNVTDLAALLSVIAGRDGLDHRQIETPFALPDYHDACQAGGSLRIGLLREGFGMPGRSDPDVDACVRAAAERFKSCGCEVTEVSVPMHRSGLAIWTGIATEGARSVMLRDNGAGFGYQGQYDTKLAGFYGQAWRRDADRLSPTVKTVLFLGSFLTEHYGGTLYTKAQNLRRALRAAYDEAFRHVDLLLMPTTPGRPSALPAMPAPTETVLNLALDMMDHTAPFDATGHPAMSLPCGGIGTLPVGLMLVGRHFEEACILAAAYRFEQKFR